MLTAYRGVLARPGALRFSVTGLVARFPISMVGIGIVLLVSTATDSYGVAGSVSAAYMIANAGFAILLGRLVDGLGQGRVLTAAAAVFGVAMVLLVVSVQADWPAAASYAWAAVAGASLPPVGSCVRARWSHVLAAPGEVQTAYALEAVADEVVFMLGPVVVTLLATAWHPVAGVGVAIVACVVGTLAFSAQRATEPPPHPHRRSAGRRQPMPWRTVVPLAIVSGALGVLFGAAEVSTVAFADEHGHRAWSGELLGLWALGSLTSGLVTGAIAWRRGPTVRVRWGALAMACAMLPLHFVGSIPLMAVVLYVGGFAIAPTMVATLSLTEASAPPGRLTEAMGIMQTGLVAGVAPGAALAGALVDGHGASAAYLVSLTAGAVAAITAQTLPRRE